MILHFLMLFNGQRTFQIYPGRNFIKRLPLFQLPMIMLFPGNHVVTKKFSACLSKSMDSALTVFMPSWKNSTNPKHPLLKKAYRVFFDQNFFFLHVST